MASHDDVAPARSRAAARAASLALPSVRGPIRRLQATTLGAGLVAALASWAVLELQSRRDYAFDVLDSRTLGQGGVTDADVTAFLTPPGGALAAAAGVLAFAAVLALVVGRLWRPARWIGSAAALLGMLTAAFWLVDGGRMVELGGVGAATLVAVGAMVVFCGVWLLIAHLGSTRAAFDG